MVRTFANLGAWWGLLSSGIDGARIDGAGIEPYGDKLVAALADATGVQRRSTSDQRAELERLGVAAQRAFADQATRHDDAVALLGVVWALLHESSAVLRASGTIATAGSGTVQQLNVSRGGVPKRAVPHAAITFRGMEGDRQAVRVHHGRPWQALCVWSGEVIDAFAAAGHPLAPGRAGENVTIRGLDWSTIRTGVRLRIGSALAECSLWALPCSSNARWFRGGDFTVMHHEQGPVSRMYATVIEPGHVATGDPVELVT
jgi:MOSC domain-containing protein YiiM